ncbi:MAG: hypothetical protein LBD27_06745 [Tannerella sp.]|jgi:hypothetical protein|nr:hypothetical protein [Tannerella sp.]
MEKNRSLAGILHGIEDGIAGVQNNPEIRERMNKYGYTPERIAAGKQLLTTARRLTASHTEQMQTVPSDTTVGDPAASSPPCGGFRRQAEVCIIFEFIIHNS